MKSSYSQNNTYKTCPKYWHWSYVERLKTNDTSSALYFGSAVDDAIMANLEGKENYMEVFHSRWISARGYGKNAPDTQIFDNPDVKFVNADFDIDLLKDEDIVDMQSWVNQLRLNKLHADPVEVFHIIRKAKRNKHKKVSASQEKYYSRCCWLSLKRKGEILIYSFISQFKPKIKKVVAVQKGMRLDTENNDTIWGFLDFVAEVEGYDKPIIIDLKTASKPYEQSKIDLTDQLTLYYAMAGEEYKTDLVGYVVLSKNINKKEIASCNTCGHFRTGRHKKCDSVVKGQRCNGEWNEKTLLDPEVQFLVQQKTEDDKKKLLDDHNNVLQAMKSGIVFRNLDKCNNWYGSRCPYYNACHKDDRTGLVKK